MNKTTIEWTHRPETGNAGYTWNPIRARLKTPLPSSATIHGARSGTFCTRISPGCTNCYASAINKRFGTGLEYTVPNLAEHEFFISEKILEEPLRMKKPATIFVGDMFDLFHEAIPVEMIAEVLRVAWKVERHTFQFLTKRADRMQRVVSEMLDRWGEPRENPRPNMWFGVSVENQKYADERIPLLLRTPAAVRFLSVEPLLEAVDLCALPSVSGIGRYLDSLSNAGVDPGADIPTKIDWVICGGESGPGARPFNLAWAESLLQQCRAANVPFFMKQMGSFPIIEESVWHRLYSPSRDYPPITPILRYFKHVERTPLGYAPLKFKDRKGGDPSEWPEHLRVREFPTPQFEVQPA